jgi:hypothetical protein
MKTPGTEWKRRIAAATRERVATSSQSRLSPSHLSALPFTAVSAMPAAFSAFYLVVGGVGDDGVVDDDGVVGIVIVTTIGR